MHFHLPIEQLARRSDTRFQLGFATEAKARMPEHEEFLLSPCDKGLRVLARNEDGLALPVEVLREAYGPALEVSPPMVRMIEGAQLQEPVMHVRISLRSSFLEVVKHAMLARGVALQEDYERGKHAVLRYEAPLARLLGLPAELSRLTAGSAQHWIVLSHYALVSGGPGGRAA
jgi:predicted membrane GTPase involved in stress response